MSTAPSPGPADHGPRDIENVVIFGSGPAGLTAALYAARANLEPLVYEGIEPGGQLMTTTDVENFPGHEEGIMGPELMDVMKKQAGRFGTRFVLDECTGIDVSSWPYTYKTSQGEGKARTIIIATGASARYLGLPNEIRLRGHGVSACATCDGFFFRGVELAVVGGGDSAAEEATFLTKFASKVHLLVRRDELRASKIMQERVFANDKVVVHWHTEVADVLGPAEVEGIRVRDARTGEETDWPHIKGLFLAIGHTPNSKAFVEQLDHHDNGYLITKPDSTATNVPGIYACGDVQDSVYRQAITAAGSGCMAALEAERWLAEQGTH
ncbi:MAG: thioredoxin-disulfide reductase [Alphaproteobacteria bacterium]|nr:thioredoxin-disulfide reductase [Alphaproteobacteria bacterium]